MTGYWQYNACMPFLKALSPSVETHPKYDTKSPVLREGVILSTIDLRSWLVLYCIHPCRIQFKFDLVGIGTQNTQRRRRYCSLFTLSFGRREIIIDSYCLRCPSFLLQTRKPLNSATKLVGDGSPLKESQLIRLSFFHLQILCLTVVRFLVTNLFCRF